MVQVPIGSDWSFEHLRGHLEMGPPDLQPVQLLAVSEADLGTDRRFVRS